MIPLTTERGDTQSGEAAAADRCQAASWGYLGLYTAVLAAAWALLEFPVVRRHVSDIQLVHWLLLAILLHLPARTLVTRLWKLSSRWDILWLLTDEVFISVLVPITGGFDSWAALFYLSPLGLSAIRHKPWHTLTVGLSGSLLYAVATWFSPNPAGYWGMLGPRLIVATGLTALVFLLARHEEAAAKELVAMRERLAREEQLSQDRAGFYREVHDGALAQVTGVALRLESIATLMLDKDPTQAARQAVDQRFRLRQAAQEVRMLHPDKDLRLAGSTGLEALLRPHVSALEQYSGIDTALRVEGTELPIPREVARSVFRVVQEALNNVERHARATTVEVTLKYQPGLLECTVRDNGVGFDPASTDADASPAPSYGLISMRDRAKQIGGHISIRSRAGQGTEVVLGVPLAGPAR